MKGQRPATGEHERVLSFLRAVRISFPDAAIVFTHGACYSLYHILREVFPAARPFLGQSRDHVVTQIGGKFYDVFGEYLDADGNPKAPVAALTDRQMEYWANVVCGQRLEYMLRKYNRPD